MSQESIIFAACSLRVHRHIIEKMKNLRRIIPGAIALLFGIFAFIFAWKSHPELLSFHEQNQMFLFSSDYFLQRFCVAGGLADYVSEYLVQFYYYSSAGAAIVALVLVLLQVLTYKALRSFDKTWILSPFVISWVLTIQMGVHMMDENTMLSFPIAIIFSLLTYLACRRAGWLCQLIASLPLYWLVGPAFILQVAFAIADSWYQKNWKKATISSLVLAAAAIAWVYTCRTLWIAQYPWDTVLAGINYHRLTIMSMESPALQAAILSSMIAVAISLPVLQYLKEKIQALRHIDVTYAIMFTCLFGGLLVYPNIQHHHHDANTHVILEQLYLERKGDWKGIISKAEEYNKQHLAALESPLSCAAVNLALEMTGQLSTRMFEFPQTGLQGLLMPRVRDNVSNVTTMEAFWHLGFINESLRYAFDSQESIPNTRKSACFTRRMAECNILNGRYDVASKYIDLLKQTLFYDSWAEIAETFLYNEPKIHGYPEWDRKLSFRLTNDFLFYYPEMTKMLGQLVLQNRDNRMAFNYFMATLLLQGDSRSFVANLPQQPQPGTDPFPRGYQQYVEYMKTHATAADAVTGASY